LRAAVLRALPRKVERAITVMHPKLPEFIMATHEIASKMVGKMIGEEGAQRPSTDYVPSTRD
jgi:hypothetical protein